MTENNSNNLTQKQFHEGLAQFTEDVLLPAIERIVDNKLEEKLESKFNEKLAPLYDRLSTIEDKLKEIEEKLDRIDKRSDEDIKGVYSEINDLKIRLAALENKVQVVQPQNI